MPGAPRGFQLGQFDTFTPGTELKLKKNPDCVVCGPNPTITKLVDYEAFCGIAPEAAASAASGVPEISVEELKAMRDRREDFVLVDVREPHEIEMAVPLSPDEVMRKRIARSEP